MGKYNTVEQISHLSASSKLGVIGNPIAHSKSPQMQQAALDSAALPYRYIRILAEREQGAFENVIERCAEKGFIGLNVTIPFKEQAYAAASQRDALSELCGASNTLVKQEDGSWHACNSDGEGFKSAILDYFKLAISEQRILILGACGGAGRAIAAQCALDGSPRISLVNRPRPELAQLRDKLAAIAPESQIDALHFDSPELAEAIASSQLIINATSLGLKESDPLPIPSELLSSEHKIFDIVTHETPLIRAARAQGCACSSGESMLLWQGAIAFERWFGQQPNINAMRAALA